MPEPRASLADHVALACRAEADKLGRPLTDEEHGCIRAGFHAALLYQIDQKVDDSFARIATDLAKLRGMRPAETITPSGE
jgi:hypothetical protein